MTLRLLAAPVGLISRFQVADRSMAPTLLPGDRLLVWRGPWRPRADQIVVLRDPEQAGRFLVKRLAEPRAEGAGGAWVVRGDNTAESRDSRSFGPVQRSLLLGVVVWRYLPGPRRGRVR